jgi:hypothetical protein
VALTWHITEAPSRSMYSIMARFVTVAAVIMLERLLFILDVQAPLLSIYSVMVHCTF